MAEFRDVEVRIMGPKDGVYGMEMRLDGSGRWVGQSKFLPDALPDDDPKAYGVALGEQLANPNFVRALDQAGLTRDQNIRLRLTIDDDARLHGVRWERTWLRIDGRAQRIAAHPRVAFSRYISVEQPDGEPPAEPVFRLLFAIANPTGLDETMRIEVAKEISAFLDVFEKGPVDRRLRAAILPGRTGLTDAAVKARIDKLGWEVLPDATSLRNVSRHLSGVFHGLHILAHGKFNPAREVGQLLLEADDGSEALVADDELQSWITPQLQLVLFQACQSAAPSREKGHPFVGLAPGLIRLGLPASVAMQDVVEVEDARRFFGAFYRTLLDEGFVDIAVNRGRQQLITEDPSRDNWSIPVLFSRLVGGRVWCADPWRQWTLETYNSLRKAAADWPPLDVIEHMRGLAGYHSLEGAEGPRFDLWTRCGVLAETADSFVVLTGPAGSFRAAQLRRIYLDFAARFLEAQSDNPPLPVSLALAELAGGQTTALPILKRFWSGDTTEEEEDRVRSRRFLFLVDAEEDITGLAREHALGALGRLKSLAGSSVVVLAGETLLRELVKAFGAATLLVAQPLGWLRIVAYLDSLNTGAARSLRDDMGQRPYADLASHPRFLQHMLDLTARKVPLRSRGAILAHVADIYLARATRVSSVSVEAAARRIAWAIQTGRDSRISGAQLYPLLNAARGERDFSLTELSQALVSECRLFVPTVNEGIRFAYPQLQSYFAASYLADIPDRQFVVEDITASLGRLARLRRWEQTLVLLAGMVRQPGQLLRTILAGSSLMEGEQLYLAVRCYQEATAEHPDSDDLDEVVHQIVDTLMWRSIWDPTRTYADRRRAIVSLVDLVQAHRLAHPDEDAEKPDVASAGVRWRKEVIEHLVTLACDPIPGSGGTDSRPQFDWSGIRLAAAEGLLALYQLTSEFVRASRPDLLAPLNAWWKLSEDSAAMKEFLRADEPRFSVIAAFALAQSLRESDHAELVEAYDQLQNEEVLWGIATALEGLDVTWLQREVIERWMPAVKTDPDARRDLRAMHVCYLIQKSNLASPAAREQLGIWLRDGSPVLQGRVLRAYSKLRDAEIERWLRPLCEKIVCGKYQEIDAATMRVSAETIANPALRRAAIEALRDIGNERSMEVVRAARAAHRESPELRQLSFQVVEEMYWRLNGGLEKETFGTGRQPS